MDKTDTFAYKVLREHFASLCASSFNPSAAANELFAKKIINSALRDVTTRTGTTPNDQRKELIDGVMRCGRPGTFQTFLQILYGDDSFLAEQIRDEYQKETGTIVVLLEHHAPICSTNTTHPHPPPKPHVVTTPPTSPAVPPLSTVTQVSVSVNTKVATEMNNGSQLATTTARKQTSVCTLVSKVAGGDYCWVSNDANSTKLKAYKMMTSPHGIALIISNIKFDKVCGLPYRAGAHVDEKSLQELFGPDCLNYKVVLLKNLTGEQIDLAFRLVSGHEGMTYAALDTEADREVLEDLSSSGNLIAASHDSFVCCLLSHGTLGVVYGTDKGKFALQNIYNYLGPCKHLAGKPKMAFIQACQGESIAEHDGAQQPSAVEDDGGITTKSSDFILSYAAFYGQKSFRWTEGKGTWYISALCRIFKEDHKKMDVVSMITDVHNEVSNEKARTARGENCRQCPRMENTLRHKVQLSIAVNKNECPMVAKRAGFILVSLIVILISVAFIMLYDNPKLFE